MNNNQVPLPPANANPAIAKPVPPAQTPVHMPQWHTTVIQC